jgi:hypothetical protein
MTTEHATASASTPLQRFVGHWRGEIHVTAAGAPPESYSQQNSFEWVLGSEFLQERGRGSNGTSFIGLWSRDPGGNQYRAHYFLAPGAQVVALLHEWHEAKQSFVGRAELGGGFCMLAEDHFIDEDSYEWTITVQDAAGTTLRHMRGVERRVRA